MTLLRTLIALVQISIQSQFLVVYFKLQPKRKAWFMLVAFFMLVLYPLDFIIPIDFILIKNIGNLLALGLFLALVFKIHNFKNLSMGIALFWLALVFCEALLMTLTYLIFDFIPDNNVYTYVNLYFQLLALPLLGLTYLVILKFLKRKNGTNYTMLFYLCVSLFNSIITALCLCFLIVPVDNHFHIFKQYYPMVILVFTSLSTLILFSLWFYTKREIERQAIRRIEETYKDQLIKQVYQNDNHQSMRQFRHDLLNYLEQKEG